MARLPRLSLAGQMHWVIQRAHPGSQIFVDAADRDTFLTALRVAAAAEQVLIHAFALLGAEVHLLVTPAIGSGLSRLMQSLGRRYVSAHHRRHGGSGTLWAGRFRCAVVEPGATLLDVLCLIDGLSAEPGSTSLEHRASGDAQPLLVDPPEYWRSGNTPFERQLAWRRRVFEGLSARRVTALRSAALGGWAVGSAAFAAQVSASAARPAAPRPRGRPRTRLA